MAFDELGQDVVAHQLDGLHRLLVAAGSQQQDQFVDAALLVAAQELRTVSGLPMGPRSGP